MTTFLRAWAAATDAFLSTLWPSPVVDAADRLAAAEAEHEDTPGFVFKTSAPGPTPVVAERPGPVGIPPLPAQGTPELVGAGDHNPPGDAAAPGADQPTLAQVIGASVQLFEWRAQALEAKGGHELAARYRQSRDAAAGFAADLRRAGAGVMPRTDAEMMLVTAQLAMIQANQTTDYRVRDHWFAVHNEARDRAAQFQAVDTV